MLLLFALWGCGPGTPEPTPIDVRFVRDGLVVEGAVSGGEPIADGRVWLAHDWTPGQASETPLGERVAPLVAECATFTALELGSLASGDGLARVAAGAMPDPALAFSPDGRWLAVGDALGGLRVLDAFTGAVRAERRLYGAVVKQLVFSDDGRHLWVGEQSQDAWLWRFRADTLAEAGRLRLADEVASSPAPAADDLYGVYTLPAAYGLVAQPGDEVVVAATHGWQDAATRRNQARVLRVGVDGDALVRRASWPAEAAADAVIHALAVHGEQVAVSLSRSASGEPPADLPLPGVQRLRLPALAADGSETFAVLAPWYSDAYVFGALAWSSAGLVAGLADGRVIVRGEPGWRVDVGTPIETAGVPIAATLGGLAVVETRAWVLASDTSVPFGATDALLRPPSPHPAANAVHGLLLADGARAGVWRAGAPLVAFAARPDQPELAVLTGPSADDGASLTWLDVSGAQPQLRARCALGGRPAGRLAVHADGRAAVVVYPEVSEAGVVGAWQVLVVR